MCARSSAWDRAPRPPRGSPPWGSEASGCEAAALQQGLDVSIPPPEVAVGLERILRAADPEKPLPEPLAVLARQAAVLAEPLDRVRIEHLAPDVGVVARAVAAREDVREIRRRVAGRHHRVVEPDVGESGCLE